MYAISPRSQAVLRAEPAVRLPGDTCRDDQVQTEEKISVQDERTNLSEAQGGEDSGWKTGMLSKKEQQDKLYLPPRF